MIEELIERSLVPAFGDIVSWHGAQYRVLGHSKDPKHWEGYAGLNAEALASPGAVLLCLDANEMSIFIPRVEAKVVKTNPLYVAERLLSYLEARRAIDWDQIEDHVREGYGDV